IAAPLGPPPRSAMVSRRPSGVTRVRVPRRISTSTTEPSAIAIGPSGNWSPVAICCIVESLEAAKDKNKGGLRNDRDEVSQIARGLAQVLEVQAVLNRVC